MTDFSKRYATDDAFREVADLLYGGGSDIVYKSSDLDSADRRKRRLTAGLSAVGATAGAAGLAYAGAKTGGAYKVARAGGKVKRLAAVGQAVKHEKFGTALIPLEVAGLGGEVMATRILHGDTKKPVAKRFKKVSKSEPGSADVHLPNGSKLKRMAAIKGAEMGTVAAKKAAPTIKGGALKVVNGAPSLEAKTKKVFKKNFDVTWEGEISKVNVDKQQVFGWASIVELDGEPVVDLQGDYISIEEVEKSAYEYVQKSRKGGDMHLRDTNDQPIHASEMIESFIVTPEKKKALGMAEDTPVGWWVGYQVNDPVVWEKVKKGERTGFSIHGRGVRS